MKPEFAIERECLPSLINYPEDLSKYDKVVIIDSQKAKYQGYPVKDSRILRRKLSNLLKLIRGKEKLKIIFR